MSLRGKHIVIAVSGGIAAYKIANVIRLLKKAGATLQVLMTPDACNFITPLTLSTLSERPVLIDYYDPKTGQWNNHVHIAQQADLILIAPATANRLAKAVTGLCDDLVQAVYLSAKSPVFFAPAMDLDMWKHPSTQYNLQKLEAYGHHIIPPGTGELASGLVGTGRLAEPEEIVAYLDNFFEDQTGSSGILQGKKAVVTAGPTHEPIDPVRFIGNHSSGKMGYSIAERLKDLGAEVTLISGPTALNKPSGLKAFVSVGSAAEMHKATLEAFTRADILVMSAAVADYTPKVVASQKIKKNDAEFHIELQKTPDILSDLGSKRRSDQILVGFALETQNELQNAQSKLERKNLDFIVLNSMQDPGAGFSYDTNKITVLSREGDKLEYPLKDKKEVAKDIVALIEKALIAKGGQSERP